MAVAAAVAGALGRKRGDLVGHHGQIESLLIGIRHHLAELLEANAAADLLVGEMGILRVVELFQLVDHRRLTEAGADGRTVVEVGPLVDAAVGCQGINTVRKLRRILVALHAKEERAEQKREQHPDLGQAGLVDPGGLERQHDRDTRADEDKRVEGTDRLGKMHMMGLRPHRGTEAKHDVAPQQRCEKHDLRGEKEPHDQFAARQRQARLVLQRDVAVVVVVATVMAMVGLVG